MVGGFFSYGGFLENKIMIWNNFINRGGVRLNVFYICKHNKEIVDNLFVSYSFFQQVS